MTWSGRTILAWRESSPLLSRLHAVDDEAPTLTGEDLPRQRVVLDSETLSFKLRARDDFGVKAVGMEWKGTDPVPNSMLAQGERMLAAGAADQESLEITGTFLRPAAGYRAASFGSAVVCGRLFSGGAAGSIRRPMCCTC